MFSWYKYLIVSLVFSHLGFWSGNLFLIAPFPDLCLLVPFGVLVTMIKDIATIFLFVSEVFNIRGHFAVLFRIRRLPREDLAARKYYFMMEVSLMVAMLCFTDQAGIFTLNV